MKALFTPLGLSAAVALALGGALAENSHAQANIPGIVGGVAEGNIAGAAAAGAGYDYWGSSGYFPGSRGSISGYQPYGANYGPNVYGPGYRSGYGIGTYSPQYGYGPQYGSGQTFGTRSYGTRFDGYSDRVTSGRQYAGSQYGTGYRPVLDNPPIDAEPYRALIVNPQENQATLRFSVDGQLYQLEPGEQQEFSGTRNRIISFDRGRSNELARYQLTDGLHTFTATDSGWELYRQPFDRAQARAAQGGGAEALQQQGPTQGAGQSPDLSGGQPNASQPRL